MSERYKINEIDDNMFYKIPKSLFNKKIYSGLNSDAILVYALLKDRFELSRKNNWTNESGEIYLLFSQDEIKELLNISVSSVSRAMKKLSEYKLIDIERQGLNKPNKIYINKVQLQSVEESRICTSENPDLHQWDSGFAPMQGNKTYNNKTEINNIKELKDKCSDSTEDRENKYRISRLINEFDRRYMKRFGEHHSPMYDNRIYEQLNSIVLSNSYYSENEDKEFQAGFDIMILAMDKYFNTKYSDCDYKIWHFLSDGILTNLLRKVAA